LAEIPSILLNLSLQQLGHLVPAQSFDAIVNLLKSLDLRLSQQQAVRGQIEPPVDPKIELSALAEQGWSTVLFLRGKY
jgi:hypothetical protein